jgi:RNA polymerase sigma factor (sigma-70 family)
MAGDTMLQSSETDDGELLRRYVSARCEDAFGAVVRRHLALVYNVALRKVGGDSHLAEDVAQRVFADLAAKAALLQRHPSITGWLFTGTHYAAAQLVRAERRRKEREQKAYAMSELSSETAAAFDWQQLRPLLDDLVLALPQRDRDALLLRYFEGRSFAEVGARLQLTDHGARARVDRAIEKLRAMLSRRGITSTSAALGLALAQQTSAAAPS